MILSSIIVKKNGPVILALFLLLPRAWSDTLKVWRDPWLGRDKVSHLALSFSLVGWGYHLVRFEWKQEPAPARAWSTGVVLSAGLAKELSDSRRPDSRFSYRDLIYDAAGVLLGVVVFTINK